MSIPPHGEKHFTASEMIRDIVIGMSDGLTVPFALAAGLTAVASSRVIVTAGLAEVAAGSIAMGLGGYLASRGDTEHYDNEQRREETEIVTVPEIEVAETEEILMQYGMTAEEARPVVEAMRKRPKQWVDFMMRFELGLDRPEPGRARASALTIAISYIVGGMIPLSAYFFIAAPRQALWLSVGVTLLALLVFGYVKGRLTGTTPIRSGVQTMLIGGIAAAAAFFLAWLVGGA